MSAAGGGDLARMVARVQRRIDRLEAREPYSEGTGGGSGSDADTLDGQDSSYFLSRPNHTGTQVPGTISPQGASSGLDADTVDATHASAFLKADGSKTLTGNLPVSVGVTVDGVDIDVFESDTVSNMVRSRDLDLELMKLCFQSIAWAQHAIYEAFDGESKRDPADPSTYQARAYRGRMDNGGNSTSGRVFGWYSKPYDYATLVALGASTDVGSGYLEDSEGAWFDDQYKNYILADSLGVERTITGCTASPRRLLVSGAPSSGVYAIYSQDPSYMVAFCTYSDSTTDGVGFVTLEVTFDGGDNWQTVLDTLNGVNLLGGTVAIDHPGREYQFRATVENDGYGASAIIHKLLICTDPSVWQ